GASTESPGRTTACEIGSRLTAPVMVNDEAGVAEGVIDHDSVGFQDFPELIRNPARMKRPARPGRVAGFFGLLFDLPFARFQTRAPLGNPAHVALCEQARSGLIDRAGGGSGRDRKPEVRAMFNRLVAR